MLTFVILLGYYLITLHYICVMISCAYLLYTLILLYFGKILLPHEYRRALLALSYILFSLFLEGGAKLFIIVYRILFYLSLI